MFKSMRATVSGQLYTETARKLYESLLETNPHSWRIEGKNRATLSDWREVVNRRGDDN